MRETPPNAPGPSWPPSVRAVTLHHTLVHVTGDLDEESLRTVEGLYPWRHVTLCASEIIVWPLGTLWVSHQPAAVVLRGRFDARDVNAVRAAHPGRAVSRDGDQITVWPGTDRQTAQENEAR